ncbi:phosphopyruvate hydratase [Nodularia spumigena CCY9414]|nr:phosphopyruvate hydratase [Nodularia spumigena CCY9414]EAW45841.1 phosphopyruvate hydratase [Nodularia spumigena CCY9414]
MIEQSKSALETYLSTGSGVKHEQVQKWANSLIIQQSLTR